MGTTPKLAIPYVESSDRLADFPASDRAQAQKVEDLIQPVTAAIYRDTAYTFPAATSTIVGMTGQQYTPVGATVNLGAGTITVLTQGQYLITASLQFLTDPSASASRQLRINLNGTGAFYANGYPNANVQLTLQISQLFRLTANTAVSIAYYGAAATLSIPTAAWRMLNGLSVVRMSN